MKTEQIVFNHLAQFNVYLPAEQLKQVVASLNTRNIFAALTALEKDETLKQHNSPALGAYKVNNSDWVQKNVKKLDKETGAVVGEFESLVDAAKSVGGREKAGNINIAAKNGGTAYGYRWIIS